MKKMNILNKIIETGLVAVIRAENEEKCEKICLACINGGIKAIEITFTVNGAEKAIKSLNDKFQDQGIIFGAGTVLDSETARIAILNGAEFIVSPSFNIEVAKLCNRYQVPYMPGCMTIAEIITAMEAGADIIKIFPGSIYGPDFIKAIKGPLPQANLMPTGGVNLENVEQWFKKGSIAVGVGSELTTFEKTGDYQEISNVANKFIEKIKKARLN